LDDVRLSVRALRGDQPPARLTTMLADLVRQAAGQQQVILTVTGDEGSISAAARAVLYRSAQEALTNARRHSGAREITVLAAFRDHDTRLVVADDGRGFDLGRHENGSDNWAAGREGFGLLGMRERAALAGGRVEIDSRSGSGTTVTVTVPRFAPVGSAMAASLAVPAGAAE
jgi:signal transduction histidine kinase